MLVLFLNRFIRVFENFIVLNEDGTMARLPQLGEIAAKFGLKIVSIKDIQEYRKKHNL